MYSGGEDGWDFFSEEFRKAGKDHRCSECRRIIHKGERHRYSRGVYDGYWDSYRQCEQCVEAIRWLMVACEGFMFDMVQEDLGEHVIGDEQYLRSAPLTRLYRWMVADWHDRAGELRPVDDVKSVTDLAIAAYKRQYNKAVA